VPSTVHVYVPAAGFPPAGALAAGVAFDGPVTVVVGAGPDAARVVTVVAVPPLVAVVVLTTPALRVVAVLDEDAGAEFEGTAAAMLVVVAASAVELVVLLGGGPAIAKEPPRRKDGGPLWVNLYPMTPAASSATDDAPATIFTRLDGPRDTCPKPPSGRSA
jgi:hypothetical protein